MRRAAGEGSSDHADASDGLVHRGADPGETAGNGAEFVAVDVDGNIYGGETRPNQRSGLMGSKWNRGGDWTLRSRSTRRPARPSTPT